MNVMRIVDSLWKDDSEIGVAVLDSETKVLLLNEKMHTLYHVKQGAELSPKTRLQQIASLSIKNRKGVAGIPIREIVGGKPLHLLLYTFPFVEKGKTESLTILFCDISGLHQFYQSQKRQEKLHLIGNIAAATANVILNPLAVIKGTVQLIEQSIKKDFAAHFSTHPLNLKLPVYFELIDQQVKQLDGMLKRFLMLGKPSELRFEPIAVVPFLQRFVALMQEQAMRHNISLVCEYPHCTGEILANEVYLREALKAIVQNAFEATPRGGSVRFKTEVDVQEVRFSITDFGGGIPPDIMENVKEPFFTTKEEALGVGLSFCEVMVEKMGGTLEIRSESGSTDVTVSLPKIR